MAAKQSIDDTYRTIDRIFHPRSIAVVGASANPDTPGYDYVQSLQHGGYKGAIYPINPKADEILGLPVSRSLRETPGDVDYVISCIPSVHILGLVEDAAAKGVRALQLFTGRFSETGKQDAIELEERLRETAREKGVRIIGPNCMGLLDPAQGISFRTDMSTAPGPIGFLSQSGNLLFELTHFAGQRGFRFSRAISYGNALDLNECDFLDYFAADSESHVVGAYIEGVRDGRRFLASAEARGHPKARRRAQRRPHQRRRPHRRLAHRRLAGTTTSGTRPSPRPAR